MRKIYTTIFLIFTTFCFSQDDVTNDLSVSLISIQVSNIDESIKWYQSNLGFNLIENNSYPDYGLKIAFLIKDDFELELIENSKLVSKEQIMKSLGKDPVLPGFVKLAFSVSKIERLYNKMLVNNIAIIQNLKQSNRVLNKQYFIVADNNGNWIQIKEK